jgi:hypothetical protein
MESEKSSASRRGDMPYQDEDVVSLLKRNRPRILRLHPPEHVHAGRQVPIFAMSASVNQWRWSRFKEASRRHQISSFGHDAPQVRKMVSEMKSSEPRTST